MVTENVNIRIRESGARVVKRRIDEIGQAANRATRGIFLLQRALFVVGGAGIVRGLVNYADALTEVENRLRLTSTSTANMEAVQDALFAAANRSRSSFTGLAEVYSRMALSTRELGVSQEETVRFTESLAKAAIISGASAREANAALIQLGQGLASSRLSGDELRSVLEQLPFVADVIAKKLGVTRGELRQFGKEGKINGKVVLEAFRDAKDEIDRLFAQTTPTVAQAFTVANNNLLAFIDRIDDSTGASAALARAIIKISENLDVLLGILLIVAGKFAISFGAGVLARIQAYAAGVTRAGAALGRYNAIQIATARSQLATNSATVAGLTARRAQLALTSQRTAATLAAAQAEFREASAIAINGRARDLNTGRFIGAQAARARLIAATEALNAAESRNAALTALSTRNTAALTAAETAAAGARGRLATATAAQSAFMVRLSNTFPLLAGGIRLVTGLFARLGTVIAANPIGALITLIFALVTAFSLWGNEIKVTSDKVVGLKDAVIAAYQLMTEAIAPFVKWFVDVHRKAINAIGDIIGTIPEFFSGIAEPIVSAVKAPINFVIAIYVGAYNAIVAAWSNLPAAFEAIGTKAINALIDIVEFGVKEIIKGVNFILNPIGSVLRSVNLPDPIGEIFDPNAVDLSGYKAKLKGEAADVGAEITTAFTDAFSRDFVGEAFNFIGDKLGSVGDAIIERARKNIEAAKAAEGKLTTGEVDLPDGTGDGGGKKGRKKKDGRSFAEIIAGLEREIALQQISNREREIANGLIDIEKELKRSLSEEETKLADATLRRLQAAEDQARILEEIKGPQEQFKADLAAINALLEQGRINTQEYAVALRDLQEAADAASNTFSGGFRSSISQAILTAGEFGEKVGGIVVGAIDSAADAIVEFAKTGKISLRSLFSELFSQLLKLAAQQLLLQLVGSLIGVPGVGLAGGATGGGGGLGGILGGLVGFAGGGSITPVGPGNTDSQVVQFAKRPDERVDILTPGQQAAQQNAMNNGGGAPPVVNNTTNVAAVLSPKDIVNVFDSDGDTVLINVLQRNASTVRSIVKG